MNKIYIKSGSSIIELIDINGNNILSIISDDFFTAYIPSVTIIKNSKKKDATISIEKINDNKLDISYPNIYYGYMELNITDIITLIEFILERSRQEKGIICIHGAGAIINDKLIACIGTTTGMGKTSLALALSAKNKFYSDEKILIDLNTLKCVGRIEKQYISNDFWKNMYGNIKYYSHQSISTKKIYKIGMFIEPIICDLEKTIIDYWPAKKALWHLYEESSRKIRGTSRVFFDNTYPVMSLDTPQLATKRLELLKKLTSKIEFLYYKGNVETIVQLVEEKVK